ncbi:MAG: Short-chain dehydrogenase/reductase SDR [Candidatus Woesebacteria bacterium GW2011_GWA1_33_30]|uniref:Short-chain dehydrogenase/reductase SDR n=1 Tax=Candidatus Woesebacteria bacterium GW2011_GWA2_33_28 TaxID=1618561 RepID=A0A0F9ZRJ3_9BACT|nr:MAG: Short-chain dehydrogenase/reductase SDR [Candidatus Woesebacteria bacterium GW2011_GWA2_33_28]KKP47576.1 MAG: Short-chain dehydrogenase/reductase SDR [Candidatus Woesebacteria bacterium GW2011_GWA1_33_30]KKP49197.1 MAG: short-chain dehydrogenase/reductase SDR [Microgenomates group bacterium GW2011_GWC1_33_32]KKP51689.1 MAG: Short-chain dehydrogenase/reductase SDR [Candidatus Woesebacteria bacterium GW2011_GWB1_33_38]KKP58470.1 MAG: Short-chain dehydrogenase/reductase SDR [Microgenomates
MTNKFAVITGASTGIGRATAIELGKNGATVALVARNKEKLEETKRLVEESGGKGIIFEADLSSIDSINKFIQSVKQQTDKVDILVNIAGIWHGVSEVFAGKDFETFDQKIVLDTFSVGLIAPTLLVHGLVSIMPQGSCIVNLSGTFENGAKGWLPYYVSKKGIEDLTLGLSDELKNKGINVNCISPSDTATEEYKKYFPEDAIDANFSETVAKEIVDLINSNQTGQFVVVKKNVLIKEGYHK